MSSTMVNQRSDGSVVHIIEASPDHWKRFIRKIGDDWGEIELAVEPWLYGMLIRGWHVGQVIGHKRPNMAGDYFLSHPSAFPSGGQKVAHNPAHSRRED